MINVLLIDDHASFRQALAFMMEREADINVIGQVGSVREGREQLATAAVPINVAVVDLDLPDGCGVDLIRELRATHSQAVVAVLTASSDRRQLARSVEVGASAVLHKSSGLQKIIESVRRLAQGEQLLTPAEILDMLRFIGEQRERDRDAQAALARLTKREWEVLRALASGANDKDIAERLHISAETARTHMVNILGKLGVDSRLQALVFAVRHGAITIE